MHQFGQGSPFHIDHVWPRSRGGPTQGDNLVLQCPHCSGSKATKVDATDPLAGRSVPLFHPLRQRWADHFDLDPGGRCIGRDPVGRAAVDVLGMDRTFPLDARSAQVAAGRLAPTATPG